MKYVSLEEGYIRFSNLKLSLISKMEDSTQKHLYTSFFSLFNELIATYFLYSDNNVSKAKNCYYEAAMSHAFSVTKLDHDPFAILRRILYSILSDNNDAISMMLNFKPKDEYEKLGAFPVHFGYAVQAIFKDDKVEMEKRIEFLIKRSKSGIFKRFVGIIIILEGFLKNETTKIEEGLSSLVKKTKSDQPGIIQEYMNIEATGLAKLAWRKGLEVNINSSFIPQFLLPVHELEQYESYDFFGNAEP